MLREGVSSLSVVDRASRLYLEYPRMIPARTDGTVAFPSPPRGATGHLRGASLLFLQFEGSSLDRCSWPLEISYAWLADGRIEARSTVIAPRADWPMHAWSEAAAEVHGLSQRAVARGRPADRVAAETDDFAGFDVVSDTPHWHQLWLDRLRAGREPRVTVRALDAAAGERLTPREADALAAALRHVGRPQRRGADARRLALAWAAASGDAVPMVRAV
jgi:hypothetical protein